MSLNPSNIDYLRDAKRIINRPGYTLNIVTGCKHWSRPDICNPEVMRCYARQMVTRGRLKGHPSYPYGFEPTFHPERIRKYGGVPKLIFLNDMADVGGDWLWKRADRPNMLYGDKSIAAYMREFAGLNPAHIILLLTKNPSWYENFRDNPPDNLHFGITATNDDELMERIQPLMQHIDLHKGKWWVSLEPWLDENAPNLNRWWCKYGWYVIGGLSGKASRSVSDDTHRWLRDRSVQAKRFAKDNCGPSIHGSPKPREYPAEWEVK